jgi:dihydrolipoamide dehydrogenase
VLEYAQDIAVYLDNQIAKTLRRSLEKQGMQFITQAKVTACEVGKSDLQLTYENMAASKTESIKGDVVLVSTGRKPYTQGLGLQEAGVQTDKQGRILVDHHLQTNVPGIYAIGDAIPGPMLAHKAEEEGVALAELLAGQAGHVNYNTVPSVIYTYPEVASVGLTEEQCKSQGLAYNAGTFPFTANGRAKALGLTDGLVKIIADANSDKILGGHIVGPRASELLGEVVIAMEFGGSAEDLARSFHAHPTLNEVVREAALAVAKRARQM